MRPRGVPSHQSLGWDPSLRSVCHLQMTGYGGHAECLHCGPLLRWVSLSLPLPTLDQLVSASSSAPAEGKIPPMFSFFKCTTLFFHFSKANLHPLKAHWIFCLS